MLTTLYNSHICLVQLAADERDAGIAFNSPSIRRHFYNQ